ncbi:adenosine deaminase [uncultured Dysosmobacter sp.]|uniref:adenosine deaminase n=1 Tax=uncultured Dysosmobacter sp. TaxID=2591384 RepID=UPI00260FE130|nr:adenosine deaminase [uncultured Dysosmobacter sp.]
MSKFTNWPKVELHRHIEGSMRVNTYVELARKNGVEMPSWEKDFIRREIELREDAPRDFSGFIRAFTYLRAVLKDKEAFTRIIIECIEDAAKENIKYLELRFNPGALVKNGIPYEDIISSVHEGVRYGEAHNDIRIGMIGIIGRDMPPELCEKATEFCVKYAHNGIDGIDLAGAETNSPTPFKPYFDCARNASLFVTNHAAEIYAPTNIIESIEQNNAIRIGHATRVMQSAEALQCLKNHQVLVEGCLISNIFTGAIDKIENHPLHELYKMGIPVLMNTDDPAVLGEIALEDEYQIAQDVLGFTDEEIQNTIIRSLDYIFRPELKKELLPKFVFS